MALLVTTFFPDAMPAFDPPHPASGDDAAQKRWCSPHRPRFARRGACLRRVGDVTLAAHRTLGETSIRRIRERQGDLSPTDDLSGPARPQAPPQLRRFRPAQRTEALRPDRQRGPLTLQN